MNLVIVSGRLGQDVELKTTSTGRSVANFSVSVYISGKKSDNNVKSIWVDVTAWGNLAEKVQKTLSKGKEVTVTGKLDVQEYTNRAGVAVKKTIIVAQSIGFMEDRMTAKGTNVEVIDYRGSDDDLPF